MRPLPLRTVLGTISVGCLVVLYLLWWTTYATTHATDGARFTRQLPPGAPGQVAGTSIRLLSLTRSERLADQQFGGPPKLAAPRTTWVVARLEAVHQPGARDFPCTIELLGPEGRLWDQQYEASRSTNCDMDKMKSGQPVQFEMVFLAPERFADQIVGVALLDPAVADRDPVITPPA
jgi:hypothetical protein